MFNADHIVVSDGLQCGYDISPHSFIVSIADGAEYPGPVLDIPVMLGIQDTEFVHISGIDPAVFGMDIMNRVFQLIDGRYGIRSLPEQMAGIKVGADGRPSGLSVE